MISTQPYRGRPVAAGARAEIAAVIRTAAAQTGVDFDYLFQQARVESSLNPAAAARTSSATGLFQFVGQTWLATLARHGAAHGLSWAAAAIERGRDGRYHVADAGLRQTILDLRYDPAASAAMAGEYAADNRRLLEDRLGRAVDGIDLYLAHFLGAGGATRFLSAMATDSSASAAALFPAAARANRSIFYADGQPRTLAEVRALFGRRLGLGSGQSDDGSAAQTYPLMADGRPLTASPVEPSSAAVLVGRAARGDAALAARSNLAAIAYMTLARLGG